MAKESDDNRLKLYGIKGVYYDVIISALDDIENCIRIHRQRFEVSS